MSPPSRCSMSTVAAAWETRKEPLAITSCCRSQSASVVSSSDLDSDSPALLTTRSRPPNASSVSSTAASHRGRVADVDLDTDGGVRSADLGGRRLRLLQRQVGDRDHGALGGELGRDRLADAGGRTGDERDAGRQRLGLRHPLELGLLERPVLDAELLRLVDRGVRREPLGAAHHVDRVDVELAGDPGGLLVLAEAEHPDAGHQHDERVRAADRPASPAQGTALRS